MATGYLGSHLTPSGGRSDVSRIPLVLSPGEVSVARDALRGIRAFCRAVLDKRVTIDAGGGSPDFGGHVYPPELYLGLILNEAEVGLNALGDDPGRVIFREVFGSPEEGMRV